MFAVVAPAHAASQAMTCELSFQTQEPLPAWNPNITATVSPASAASGASVKVTVDVGQYTNGPVPIPAGQITPSATVALSGGQTGNVTVKGPANTAAVPAQQAFKVAPMTGTFKATGSGKVDMKVTKVFFDNPQVDTTCTPSGSAVTVGSMTISGTSAAPTAPAAPAADPNLASTGPGDVTRNALIGLLVLQLGLIVFVRSRRAGV